jgi:hypothetical protein
MRKKEKTECREKKKDQGGRKDEQETSSWYAVSSDWVWSFACLRADFKYHSRDSGNPGKSHTRQSIPRSDYN